MEISKPKERHIIPISGKDSLATALLQTTRYPDLPYEFFFNDIGTELPETYEWLSHIEKVKGWKIIRVGKNLKDLIYKRNFLPQPRARYCTSDTKIKPMEQYFKGEQIYVYYGLRVDEDRVGKRPSDQMIHVYPLREMNIDLRGVWTILKHQNLLPPSFFWNSLYYRVCELAGLFWTAIDELEEWEVRMLFAGRSRSNCYMCFYQRQYEYLWLSETHPELFRESCRMERVVGRNDYGNKDFSWRQGYFLDEKIMQERDRILTKRAKKVLEIIRKRMNRGLFFNDLELENELSMTSCGLLCGK